MADAVARFVNRIWGTDSSAAVRATAAEAIGEIPTESAQAVRGLSRLLDDPDDRVIVAALASLTRMGSLAGESTGAVVALLDHERVDIRSAAVACLAKIEPNASKSVPLLIAALNDEEWTVRRDAAEALGAMGGQAKAAVPVLFRMLSSEDDEDAARGALRSIDDADADAVPVLIEGLESEDRRRRFYATFLLGKVGPDAKEALPILRRLRDETESTRYRDSIQKTIDAIEK